MRAPRLRLAAVVLAAFALGGWAAAQTAPTPAQARRVQRRADRRRLAELRAAERAEVQALNLQERSDLSAVAARNAADADKRAEERRVREAYKLKRKDVRLRYKPQLDDLRARIAAEGPAHRGAAPPPGASSDAPPAQ